MQTMNDLGDTDVELQSDEAEAALADLERAADEAPIVKLVNLILTDAVKRGASDIHMEPYEKEFRVRFRIDGVLQAIMSPPLKLKDAITSRLKIMSKLDISEKRLPQDGRIMLKMNLGGKKSSSISASAPCPLCGAKNRHASPRQGESPPRHDQAGLRAGIAHQVRKSHSQALRHGAGYGTHGFRQNHTLYSSIARLKHARHQYHDRRGPGRVPAGRREPGADEGANWPELRRCPACLPAARSQHHPGGEIRDFETAEIAIKAALTGHLVLSTLHTNGAPETITRLMNMGIEPFLVATSVHLICAQRLIRRVCKECAEPFEVPIQTLIDEGYGPEEANVKLMKGKGCGVCNNTGYKGRTGLYEVMEVDDEIRELVLVGASALELKKKAIERA